jgi:hypothetical protein
MQPGIIAEIELDQAPQVRRAIDVQVMDREPGTARFDMPNSGLDPDTYIAVIESE